MDITWVHIPALFTSDRIIALATVLYAGVTIVMFFSIRSQAKAIHRQVDIAARAAGAAEKSADTLVSTERAWVFGNIEPFPGDGTIVPDSDELSHLLKVVRVNYTLTNYGHTPACITAIGVRSHQFDNLEDAVTGPPDYGQIVQVCDYLAPGKVGGSFFLMAPNDFISINRQEKFLIICGKIEYEDVYGNCHTTKFCFDYHRPLGLDMRPAGFYRFGGKSRNNQT